MLLVLSLLERELLLELGLEVLKLESQLRVTRTGVARGPWDSTIGSRWVNATA